MDYSVCGILHARILEFIADLPDPEIKPGSPALQADSLPTELSGRPVELKSRSENVGLGMEVKSSYPSSTCRKTIK